MAVTLMDGVILSFFVFEFYHGFAHICILTGLRSLPRKDLARSPYYFFAECLTMFVSTFVLLGRLHLMATVHILTHMYYYITWDKTYMAKKIVDWSCLEWYKDKHARPIQLDSTLITVYDCVSHVALVYLFGQQMHWTGILLGIFLSSAALKAVMFNPRLAWSNPNNMPDWVEKRLGDLALKYD